MESNRPEVRMRIKRSSNPSINRKAEAHVKQAEAQERKATGEMALSQMIGIAVMIAAIAVAVSLIL